jgi:hypothetical protein
MWFSARFAAGKLTLLCWGSAASRTTDSEYLFLVGFVFFHGGKRKRSTRVFKSSVRQRTPYFGQALNHRLGSHGVVRNVYCVPRVYTEGLALEFP